MIDTITRIDDRSVVRPVRELEISAQRSSDPDTRARHRALAKAARAADVKELARMGWCPLTVEAETSFADGFGDALKNVGGM